MGMTIDESIYCMNSYLPNSEGMVCQNCKYYGSKEGIFCHSSEAHKMAISTMRKYKKIEKIVEHWACCGYPSDSMIAIKEVIEDQ